MSRNGYYGTPSTVDLYCLYLHCFGVGVRLVNFGSFTFLCAVACCGWKNGNVPKCAGVCVGELGSSLHCLSGFMRCRRVSGNAKYLYIIVGRWRNTNQRGRNLPSLRVKRSNIYLPHSQLYKQCFCTNATFFVKQSSNRLI